MEKYYLRENYGKCNRPGERKIRIIVQKLEETVSI